MQLIALSGASGSGKSFFTFALAEQLRAQGLRVEILCEDQYYRAQDERSFAERCQQNYDHPAAFEHELLAQHLQQLKLGQTIQAPCYDYATHTRSKNHIIVHAADIVLLDGILLLHNEQLLPLFDVRVFIDTPLDICFIRRLQRDMSERGRSQQSVIDQYLDTVRPMYQQYIAPSKRHADYVLDCSGDIQAHLQTLRTAIINLEN